MKISKIQSFEIDNRLQLLAIFLLLIVAIPALRNGWKFMYDPSGKSTGFPPELLTNLDIKSYLLPGIVLFFIFGILSIVAALFVFLEVKNYPWMVMGQGILLLIWLAGEVLFGVSVANLQNPFFVLGFFLLLVGYLMLFKQIKRQRRLEG
jgi:hypothetical protein